MEYDEIERRKQIADFVDECKRRLRIVGIAIHLAPVSDHVEGAFFGEIASAQYAAAQVFDGAQCGAFGCIAPKQRNIRRREVGVFVDGSHCHRSTFSIAFVALGAHQCKLGTSFATGVGFDDFFERRKCFIAIFELSQA